MTTLLVDDDTEKVSRPKIALFWLSLLSVAIPITFVMMSMTVGYLIGYLSVLLVTVPAGLAFKAQGMNMESVGASGTTYAGQRRATKWIFFLSSLLAVACALRFAIAVS